MVAELRLGIPKATLESKARQIAKTEWVDYHRRQGIDPPPGEPRVEFIRDDPRRETLGEYLMIVTAGGGADGNGGDQ